MDEWMTKENLKVENVQGCMYPVIRVQRIQHGSKISMRKNIYEKMFKFSKYDLSKYKLISELAPPPSPLLPSILIFYSQFEKKGILERCQFIIFRNFY